MDVTVTVLTSLCCSMDGYMSLSGLRPWPEERLGEFGRRHYYGVEAGTHDAQGRIDRCAHPQASCGYILAQRPS